MLLLFKLSTTPSTYTKMMFSRTSLPVVALAAGAALAKPIIQDDGPKVSDCTSTTYTTGTVPAPPATWQPTVTVTVHTATTTTSPAVNCGSCAHLETQRIYINYLQPSGPSPMVTQTVTATEPAVATVAHCQAPRGQPLLRHDQDVDAPPEATPAPSTSGCTKQLFHAQAFTWGPVRTIWTSTATVTRKVNCGPCTALQLNYFPQGPGPVVFFPTTVTATTASTTTIPVCGATGTEDVFGRSVATGSRYYQAPPFSVHTALPSAGSGGGAPPECTAHDHVAPEVPNQTFTEYPATVTETRDVQCGSCALVWSTPVLEFFAPILLTATETATTPSTSVELACATATAA